MEYGKLVELVQAHIGYETTEEAQIALGKFFYTLASDEQIATMAKTLTKGND